MPNCSENWNLSLNVFTVLAYSISSFLFMGICLVHFKAREDLHPLFVTSFMTILMSYAVCDLFAVMHQVFTFLNLNEDATMYIYYIYQACYIITSPFVVITLIERFFATIYTNSYEYSRPWGSYFSALFISGAVALLHTIIMKYAESIFVTQLVLLVISVIILMGLAALLIVNRKLVVQSRGRCHLSKRYQITENVKSLRLLVPVVVLDTLVSITDFIGLVFFDVDSSFEMAKCSQYSFYLPAYIILRLLSLIFEVLIPVAVIHRHHAFRRALEKYVAKSSTVSAPGALAHFDKKTLKIKNILGMDISPNENVDHFDVLQQHWMKKF